MPRVHNKKRPLKSPKELAELKAGKGSAGDFHPDDRVASFRMVIDDKHKFESDYNRSTRVIRECDFYMGDLHDIWRVRAIPAGGGTENIYTANPGIQGDEVRGTTGLAGVAGAVTLKQKFAAQKRGPRSVLDGGPDPDDAVMRLMWLINDIKGGEGGWVTTAAATGMGRVDALRDHNSVAPPLRIGQIGDVIGLTADDQTQSTRDGDALSIVNVWHYAHFHKTAGLDGRIHFEGLPFPWIDLLYNVKWIKSKIVCEPQFKDQETPLGKESGQWMVETPIPDGFVDRPAWAEDTIWTPVPLPIPSPKEGAYLLGTRAKVGQMPSPDTIEYGPRGVGISPKTGFIFHWVGEQQYIQADVDLGNCSGPWGYAPYLEMEYFVSNPGPFDAYATVRAFFVIVDANENLVFSSVGIADFDWSQLATGGGYTTDAGGAIIGYRDVVLCIPGGNSGAKKLHYEAPLLGYSNVVDLYSGDTILSPNTHGKSKPNANVVVTRPNHDNAITDTIGSHIVVFPKITQKAITERPGVNPPASPICATPPI